ncbi:MAG: ribonuclease P protein component [Clostridiales bacterium]|nr:ribonuclease P protein component [Clostridiales bacterium]
MSDIVSITQNNDFRRAYSRGKSKACPSLVAYRVKNRAGLCRVGITTGKKLGGAVERNRCRRVIKEAYRHLSPLCAGSWDIVFVARSKVLKMKSHEVEKDMFKLLCALGIINTSAERP